MKLALTVGLVVLAPLLQAALAPLFPLEGAQPDLVLLGLFVIAVAAGPRMAMGALAPMALLLAFATGRAPALLIAGYLPLLPLGYGLEGARVPLNRFARSLIAVAATGVWVRLLLALGAFADGADFSLRVLAGDLLIPGAILDVVLLAMLYLPLRLTGMTARSFTPARTGWFN